MRLRQYVEIIVFSALSMILVRLVADLFFQ